VNLHRFLDLVRDFSRTSQVLLVTHQKRTMEAADVLYGVSMSKDGASAVICQRIGESVTAGAAPSDR
jgi:chromosome segregation protein